MDHLFGPVLSRVSFLVGLHGTNFLNGLLKQCVTKLPKHDETAAVLVTSPHFNCKIYATSLCFSEKPPCVRGIVDRLQHSNNTLVNDSVRPMLAFSVFFLPPSALNEVGVSARQHIGNRHSNPLLQLPTDKRKS
jgi:hypothetical protein